MSFVFVLPFYVGKGTSTLLTADRGRPANCVLISICVVHDNFLHYRALAYKSIVAVEVKPKNKRETKAKLPNIRREYTG